MTETIDDRAQLAPGRRGVVANEGTAAALCRTLNRDAQHPASKSYAEMYDTLEPVVGRCRGGMER